MNKKVSIGVVTLLLGTWMIISLTLPPKLVASSNDGKFDAVYTVSHSLKETWAGQVEWDESEGVIVNLSFYENDTQLTGEIVGDPIEMLQSNSYEFAFLGAEPNPDSIYTLRISVEEKGERHEEILTFKPRKRLFVLPTID
ncbi:hypothetical protein [Exiguobacterium sp.]|uniref:hypothetical protein n=1 Tax=Exiguobacterium sp. TaxID=44751 RepID=UPI00263B8050|nr:hypothetical protein [Exiguobacterium sp.]MCC5892035.1 hypothetical protein [Exiguobacterium sp.]